MKLRAWIASILGTAYLCFLALCSLSGPLSADSPLAFFNDNVYLSNGGYPADSTAITAVLTAEDLEHLNEFANLSSLDLSGSTCYEAINTWSEAHPSVSVKYTVPLPCSLTADNATETLDMTAISDTEIPQLQAQLQYLPKLKSVNMGGGTAAEHLDFDALSALVEAYPETDFTYTLDILGQQTTLEASDLDLSHITSADVETMVPLLKCMTRLRSVTLGDEESCDLSLEEIARLVSACPQAGFDYSGTVCGVDYTLADTTLDLNHIKIDDEGAAVRKVVACMNKLETLDMDYCGVSNAAMEAIRADFPNVDVIWRIWFGDAYSVRTDAEKILASKPSVGGLMTAEDCEVLKYCTKIKYLDLGHNGDNDTVGVSDISFTSYMPDLEVFIISMNQVTDLSPLSNCNKLEYLEVYSTPVSDLSPLSGLDTLRHLNLQNMPNLTDISPIYGLTGLERVWIGCDSPVPAEQVEEFKSKVPNCEVNTTDSNTNAWKWSYVSLDPYEGYEIYHYVPRYLLLRTQLGYDETEYSFYWLDPKCGDPAPAQYAGRFGKGASG